jgi:hypothetical protein
MIYRVYIDDVSIYESNGDVIIVEPRVSTELNSAGSFEFKMPPNHAYWSMPKVLTQTVRVFEDDELVFFGRPTEIKLDFKNQKLVYCEGALSYFNDSIQRPAEWNKISLREFFSTLIQNHNQQVPRNRQFVLGEFTMEDVEVYRKLDYETTFQCLQEMCVEAEGGYLFTRNVNGINFIDWHYSMPYVGDQPVQYGLNLVDMTQDIVGTEFYTAVIPVGKDGLTIKSVNGGLDYVVSDAARSYGLITTKVDFDDISDPGELMAMGELWLSSQQFENLTIECTAAELHYLTNSYTAFRVGQTVHVTSEPHILDANFPIVKLELDLDKAGKQVTIGTVPRRELTKIVKDEEGSGKSEVNIAFDATPTAGSNNAVTSAGIYAALGDLRFSRNQNGTVRVEAIH